MSTGNSKAVLLISRGTMSGAKMIADCLAKSEHLRCLTREDLVAAVNNYGELATRIAARISKADQAYEEFSELRLPYQILMRLALLEFVRQGNVAYFGYSGHLLTRPIPHFVRIRLIAPMDVRVARTCEALGYSAREAREYIHNVDQQRAHWGRMMYGVDIREPSGYDICLNVERLSLAGACAMLRQVLEQEDFQPTADSLTQVENEYLATQALAALVTDSRTLRIEMGATVAEGVLRLVGPYLSDSEIQSVQTVAGSVAGVRKVEYEPGYTPAFRCAS